MASDRTPPNGWRYESIGALETAGIVQDIQDGNHGEKHPKAADYVPSGVPFVMAKDIEGNRLNLTDCAFIPRSLADSLRIGFSRPGDVLLTHKATMGRVAIVPEGYDYIMLTPQVTYYRVGDPKQLSNAYLKYAFLGPDFQYQLNSDSDQSTRKYIGITAQRRLRIPLPPLKEQQAIAHVLGTLDRKVELNRMLNQTLGAIARSLFKSWFVDFDPIRAKAEKRDSGLPEALARLFTSTFEKSEIGGIPKDWKVAGLDELGRFLNGLALQKFPPQGDRFLPVIKIAQLRSEDTSDADRASADLAPEYVVNDGDVLFSWSGSLECILWAAGRGALNQHLFKVTSEVYPKWFYFLWIGEHLEEFRHIAAGKATTMGHIQRGHLSSAKVLIPPAELLNEIGRFFAPLIDQIVNLKLVSNTLVSIRDALLPKLVSGELRVPDAERILGAQL